MAGDEARAAEAKASRKVASAPKERSIYGAAVGVVVLLCMFVYALLGGGAFQALELFFYRTFFPIDPHGSSRSPHVVVLTKDEGANDYVQLRYRRPPNRWPRQAHADLLRRLTDLGAKVVGFDFVFQGPDVAATDRAFRESLERHGRTVLGMYRNIRQMKRGGTAALGSSQGAHYETSYLFPHGPFQRSAAGCGLLNIAMGEDRRVREWIPLSYDRDLDPALGAVPPPSGDGDGGDGGDGDEGEEDEGEDLGFVDRDRDLIPAWDLLLLLLYRDFDLRKIYADGRWVDRAWKEEICARYRRGDFAAGLDFVQGERRLHVPLNSEGHCLIPYEKPGYFETFSIANLLDPEEFVQLGQPETFGPGRSEGNGGDAAKGRESLRLLLSEKGKANLRIRCLDGRGQGIENVEVLLAAVAEGFWARGRSDAEGALTFRELPEGNYRAHMVRRLGGTDRQITQIATLRFADGQGRRRFQALRADRWRRVTVRFPEPTRALAGRVALEAGRGGEGVAFCLRGRDLAFADGDDFQEQIVTRCSSDGGWRILTSLPVDESDQEFAGTAVAWRPEAGGGSWPPLWARKQARSAMDLAELRGDVLPVLRSPGESPRAEIRLAAITDTGRAGQEVWLLVADEADGFWPARLEEHPRPLPLPAGGGEFGPVPVSNPEGRYRLFVRGVEGDLRGKWVHNRGTFAGKIVLIGPTAQVDHDNHLTPVESSLLVGVGEHSQTTPGVIIHGHAIEGIVTGRAIRVPTGANDFEKVGKAAPFWLAMAVMLPAFGAFIRPHSARKALLWTFVTMLAILGAGLVLRIAFDVWVQVMTPMLFVFVTSLGVALLNYETVDKKRREVRGMFGKYLAPALVAQMEADPTKVSLGGETKEITAFFSDIAGFSSFSEKMTPEALVSFLNIYCSEMTEILLNHQGYLDKYIGDALVGIFGAPIALEDHRLAGLLTAVDMQQRLKELGPVWREAGYPEVITRIGLNTGPALVGNMGSKERLNYTMMGDTVNLASRLEGANKAYGTLIMVAEECLVGQEDRFEHRFLDLLAVKGKTRPVKVFELMGRAGDLDERVEDMRIHYLAGITAYERRDWAEAVRCFQKALEILPEDGPSNAYLDRCFEYLRQPPPENWDGVFRMKTK